MKMHNISNPTTVLVTVSRLTQNLKLSYYGKINICSMEQPARPSTFGLPTLEPATLSETSASQRPLNASVRPTERVQYSLPAHYMLNCSLRNSVSTSSLPNEHYSCVLTEAVRPVPLHLSAASSETSAKGFDKPNFINESNLA